MGIDYKAIGKRVKVARIRQDIKQEALAEKVNISASHMSNIETGKTKLSLPTIISLANALDVSVDELLSDNVNHSAEIYNSEAQRILEDCTTSEARIIVKVMTATKNAIRENTKTATE